MSRSFAELTLRRVALAVGVVGALSASAPASLGALAPAPAAAVQDVLWYQQCANGGASMMGSWGDGNYSAGAQCPAANAGNGFSGLWLFSNGTGAGTVAHWEADAPGNIGIVMAHAPEMATYFPSYFYGGFFYWAGGNSGWLNNTDTGAIAWPSGSGWQSFGSSPYFGFELACNAATQCATRGAWFDVFDLQLEANEYQTPNIYAGPASGAAHLWYQAGKWIRGVFPLDVRGTDPSGVCRMLVSWNGQIVQDSGERAPNGAFWDQCDPNHSPNSPQDFFVGATLDTRTTVPTSARGVPLALLSHNASYNPATGAPDWTSDVEYLDVDNEPVGLSLTGPAQASIGDGTQQVTATATAGPSGVGAIVCSVDGSRWTGERMSGGGSGAATAEVPVSGLGQHQVSCYATNQSVDSSGQPAASAIQTWSLKIGEPVGAGITFAKVIRHCSRELRRVHTRTGTRRKWVRVCTTRTVPHHVAHIAYGRGVNVYGWLTRSNGIPIGRAPVTILAAPDNGSGAWHTAAVVSTSADGSWQATLHPGPSRLIQATYAGGPDTEAASSAVVKVIVPAKVVLTHVTRHVPWGGVLVIRGRLLGGNIPHEQILQLRTGVGRHLQVIGNPYIGRDGRFVIRLAATGSGGPLRTQIAVTTLKETNYPYARGSSPRVWVTIG